MQRLCGWLNSQWCDAVDFLVWTWSGQQGDSDYLSLLNSDMLLHWFRSQTPKGQRLLSGNRNEKMRQCCLNTNGVQIIPFCFLIYWCRYCLLQLELLLWIQQSQTLDKAASPWKSNCTIRLRLSDHMIQLAVHYPSILLCGINYSKTEISRNWISHSKGNIYQDIHKCSEAPLTTTHDT